MRSIKFLVKNNAPQLFSLLSKIKQSFLSVLIARQKRSIPKVLEQYYGNNSEVSEIVDYVRSHSVEMIPYRFTDDYRSMKFDIIKEDDLWMALIDGTPVYFPGNMEKQYVIDSIKVGLMEQDVRSPHRYLPVGSIDIGGDVAILCGASDCIYALKIIDKFRKIYLFEANRNWVKAIERTMKNHLHKIEIVPYYISNENRANSITLDAFFENKPDVIDYIQADIENDELKMLIGASKTLNKNASVKIAICCYHTPVQKQELSAFLKSMNFKVQESLGYVLMWMEFPLRAPYLRRAVLYASREF